jgi:hypothetical protein
MRKPDLVDASDVVVPDGTPEVDGFTAIVNAEEAAKLTNGDKAEDVLRMGRCLKRALEICINSNISGIQPTYLVEDCR